MGDCLIKKRPPVCSTLVWLQNSSLFWIVSQLQNFRLHFKDIQVLDPPLGVLNRISVKVRVRFRVMLKLN